MRNHLFINTKSLLFAVAIIAALPAGATTVDISDVPSGPIFEVGQEILFSASAPGAQLGSLFQIGVEDESLPSSTTSTPSFQLTIDDVTDHVSATFNATFTGAPGVGGTITFSGSPENINGVDFATVTNGFYTFGVVPTFTLNAENTTGVGKVSLLSGVITSSVPEPATWTFLVAGFVLMAGFLRRPILSTARKSSSAAGH